MNIQLTSKKIKKKKKQDKNRRTTIARVHQAGRRYRERAYNTKG